MALQPFSWSQCGASTPTGPCQDVGDGLGGRCPSHWSFTGSTGPLVLLNQLRSSCELGDSIPDGPARVFVMPAKIWDGVAEDDEWPERLLPPEYGPPPATRQAGKVHGVTLPNGLRPSHGGWPQVVSGRTARKLLRQPGAVSRIIATAGYIDGWWLRELLTRKTTPAEAAGILARFEYRFGEPSPGAANPAHLAAMITDNRAFYAADITAGASAWT